MAKQSTFSYKNYFRPTPEGLQRFFLGMKTIVMAGAGGVLISGNPFWSTIILFFGAFLDELAKFFGHIAEDQEKVTVTGDNLTVIKADVPK